MERHIRLEGASNFRDLGGYKTADGAVTKWRTMFRSDTPANLTPGDLATVSGLGVTVACDLRYGEERDTEVSQYRAHPEIDVLELGLDQRPGQSFVDSFQVAQDIVAEAQNYLLTNYAEYPLRYNHAYLGMFDRLIAGDRLVVHCTAGKDRAGTAAALLLSALGVPRDTVFEDYLLTNDYWDPSGRDTGELDAEARKAIFSAREEYLAQAFKTIDERFGGVDAYLADYVGLTNEKRAALQSACLD